MTRILARHAAHGALWAALLLLTPIVYLILASPFLVPFYFWREAKSFRPVFPMMEATVRYGILAGLVIGGAMLPIGSAHERIQPLPSQQVTLAKLVEVDAIKFFGSSEVLTQEILLQSRSPTRPELQEAIEQQTDLDARVNHCSYVANLLFGSSVGPVFVGDPRPVLKAKLPNNGN